MNAKDMFNLEGEVTIVTGAARGMGKALATGFAEMGAKVVIADLDEKVGEETAQELRDAGHQVIAVKANQADKSDIENLIKTTEQEFGPVDILINNAGILGIYTILEQTEEDWDKILNVNLRGPMLLMKAVLPGMVERKHGNIINIGSSYSARSALMNFSGGGPDYCVSKSGIQALTRISAQHVAASGVRINAIGPGVVDTPMHTENQELIKSMIPYIPLGRLQSADDIVGAAIYLASPASSYVTGQVLHVNGGMIMTD